jgi:hypothetical protein
LSVYVLVDIVTPLSNGCDYQNGAALISGPLYML